MVYVCCVCVLCMCVCVFVCECVCVFVNYFCVHFPEELQQQAGVFKRTAKGLNRSAWWSNIIPTSVFSSTNTTSSAHHPPHHALPSAVVPSKFTASSSNRPERVSVGAAPPLSPSMTQTKAIIRSQQQVYDCDSLGAETLEQLGQQRQSLVRNKSILLFNFSPHA